MAGSSSVSIRTKPWRAFPAGISMAFNPDGAAARSRGSAIWHTPFQPCFRHPVRGSENSMRNLENRFFGPAAQKIRNRAVRAVPVKLARLRLKAPIASFTFDDFAKSAWQVGGRL